MTDLNAPKEPGWYWCRSEPVGWEVARVMEDPLMDGMLQCTVPSRPDLFYLEEVEWGPRVPDPEALLTASEEDMFSEISTLIEEDKFDEAENRLDELREVIDKRVGISGFSHPRCTYLSTTIAFFRHPLG